MNRAVFLDRDGTINKGVGFCCLPEDFELLPGVAKAIKRLNDMDFKVLVLTNQSGVARGYLSEETLNAIHRKMKSELAKEGAYLDAIYCCPHLPQNGCQCHKPKPGLALQAIREHDVDVTNSYIVGDTGSDAAMGKAIGLKTIKVGSVPNWPGQEADIAVASLSEAIEIIIRKKVVMVVGSRGVGKSEVRKVFEEFGFIHVDTEDKYLKYGRLYPEENVGMNREVMDRIYMELSDEVLLHCHEGNVVFESTGTNPRWAEVKRKVGEFHLIFVVKVDCPLTIATNRTQSRGWERNYPSPKEKTLNIFENSRYLEFDFLVRNSGTMENLHNEVSKIAQRILADERQN